MNERIARRKQFPSLRGHGSSILIAALSSSFGVSLLTVTGVLSQVLESSGIRSGTLTFILSFISLVFIAIAVYVGAIVITNTFATIIAGRTQTIALMRLIGASASAQRRTIAHEGLLVGATGAIVGAGVGIALTASIVTVGSEVGLIPSRNYTFVGPTILIPLAAVIATTWAASWSGSRRVLNVSPLEATRAAVESSLEEQSAKRGRNVAAMVLFVIGITALIAGVIVGLTDPRGVFIGLIGGLTSFSAVIMSAEVVMPRVLQIVGGLFGTSATARLARANAVRYPQRSARTTIGLVIGVTLVTTFAVTLSSFYGIIQTAQRAQPDAYSGVEETLHIMVIVFSVLTGFSALIAGIGLANNLSLNVFQRTKELGLLRALGFTKRQVRKMIFIESAQLTASAVAVGLILGVFYGWAGAQSLIGGILGSPGIVLPVVPFALLLGVMIASVALATIASVIPARRVTRIKPIAALASQ
ncbi:FtsX-like permease family protein [Rhodoglobus sp.]